MKQRFSSLDVKAIAHELSQSLVTLRLSNVYDLSSKIMLFKFAKPDSKKQLVVDAGFRCHLTDFSRTTAAAPSGFVARLRKFLKTRRVTSVAQVGTDRVIEFVFSDGSYRLFLEFFAGGNVILTDHDLRILALLRIVHEGEGQEPQKIGLTYAIEQRQNYGGVPPLTRERLRDALETIAERTAKTEGSEGKKRKSKPGEVLRKGLATTITEIPPVLVEHVLLASEFNVDASPTEILASEALLDHLFDALQDARILVDESPGTATCKGYIVAKYKPGYIADAESASTPAKREDLIYEDFHPFRPHKFATNPSYTILTYDSFNKTVDDFYSSIEGQKLESRLNEREAMAKKKLDAAKKDQAKRLEGLQEAQILSNRKAAAIEANIERVQEAMDAVNGLLDNGMDWVDVGKLVAREQKHGNPVAEIIKLPMKLAENTITLLLGEEEEDVESDAGYSTDSSASDSEVEDKNDAKTSTTTKLAIEINLGLSPWANAREYYDQKRSAADKAQKTAFQADRAMKSAEQKIKQDLKKGLKQEKPVLHLLRQQLWFEKFLWFVSSDGYLVLAGKDAPQSEILYKRHLRKGDIYCHADIPNAAHVIIKNNPSTPDAPIPPSTLSQAGILSVSTSNAWDSKAVMAAWWVKAEQVSKTYSKGEVLPPGSFNVTGEKNYLPPAPLLLGFGVLFRVGEESKSKHTKHRIYASVGGGTEELASASEIPVSDEKVAGKNATEDTAAKEPEEAEAEVDSDNEDQDERPANNPLQSSGHGEDEAESKNTNDMETLTLEDKPADGDEQSEDENEASPDSATSDVELQSTVAPSTYAASTVTSEKRQQPKRGQRGKAKKMATKYRHQDEEDRQAVATLIGSTAGRQRAEAEAKAKAQREAELEAQRERRRAQHQKQQQATAEHEARRQKMLEEGLDVAGPGETEDLAAVEELVGTPLPGDEILEAVAICAPWAAMGKTKYKIKIQPGSLKKGRAVKDMIERWRYDCERKGSVDPRSEDVEKIWPREAELIKAFRPEEVVNVVPVGKVSIMAPGGAGSTGGKGGKGGQAKGQQGKGGKGGKKK
ncbi:hypothetical protein jhhlp_003790 [Lomentospora prolificans]|uniref:Ribosome quality control complex subunit 2 n=1 Tax=Lomentospora prolificans TaxID=41688 RepID=A0A2N3N9Q2_9PEZI|nr:hypothetical protein jhhlp_003790 [Lomentospora prolificans]